MPAGPTDPMTTLPCHGPSNTVWFPAPARHRGFGQSRAGSKRAGSKAGAALLAAAKVELPAGAAAAAGVELAAGAAG